jgi:hypothetical protein
MFLFVRPFVCKIYNDCLLFNINIKILKLFVLSRTFVIDIFYLDFLTKCYIIKIRPPDICGDWYSTGYMWRLVFHRIYVEIGIPPDICGDWYSTGYMWRLVFHQIYVEIGILLTCEKHLHDVSIKSGGVKLVLWAQPFFLK